MKFAMATIHYWGFELAEHPSYAPNLSQSDHKLLTKLKFELIYIFELNNQF